MPDLNINGRSMSVDAANDSPLLWAIREQLQMTGTKFGKPPLEPSRPSKPQQQTLC